MPASREKQEQEALPQRSGQTSEQQTQQCAQAQLADMEPALAVHDTAVRSLPIMLPEKLNRNKVRMAYDVEPGVVPPTTLREGGELSLLNIVQQHSILALKYA